MSHDFEYAISKYTSIYHPRSLVHLIVIIIAQQNECGLARALSNTRTALLRHKLGCQQYTLRRVFMHLIILWLQNIYPFPPFGLTLIAYPFELPPYGISYI